MSHSESHSIRNGIIATVAGGLILAALGLVWPPAKTALHWCAQALEAIWQALISTYSVPGWLVLLLGLVSLIAMAILIAQLARNNTPSPSHLSYIKDSIHGVNWHWSWTSSGIANLWSTCPTCQGQLVFINNPDAPYISNPRVKLLCENCNHVITEIKGIDHSYALASVEREILRRLRVSGSQSQADAR